MSYEDYHQTQNSAAAYGFSAQLSREVDKIKGYGISGLHDNKCEKGALKQDAQTPKKYFNFFMRDAVFDLGCQLEKKHKIEPVTWASWMMNCDLWEGQNSVVIYCPGQWRTQEAEKRFKHTISAHYKGKSVVFISDEALMRELKNL
jgi:hypothetical protein